MNSLEASERVFPNSTTSAIDGKVICSPAKTLWFWGHGILGISGLIIYPELGAASAFVLLTAITICAGHSVGMHRLLIHRSFETYPIIEYFLVWLGTLVGMAGPIGMIKTHDMRDWHQRQTTCPRHPAHQAGFFKDAWWQLCCEFRLTSPPTIKIEDKVRLNIVYSGMEKTWRIQQIVLALPLYLVGGWAWVLWGCSLRIFVSLAGHWMVGHYAHKHGHQIWRIQGLPVQGYNLPHWGILTFGENWHGNHHAFPHSAKLGIEPGQTDLGFLLIRSLEKLGLAWNIKVPDSEEPRTGLVRV